jgi:hypothetical protein
LKRDAERASTVAPGSGALAAVALLEEGEVAFLATPRVGSSIGDVAGDLSRSTGARVCDATVVVSDGSYRETLQPGVFAPTERDAQCTFVGAGERPGTYTVVARPQGPDFALTGGRAHALRR